MRYLKRDNLLKLLEGLREEYEVYVPVKKGEQRFYERYVEALVVGEVRAFEPLKAFFSRAREVVAEGFKAEAPHLSDKPLAIVGAKSCDLKGFKVQDYVFKNGDYEDPFYVKARSGNLIISADCTMALDTCFCLAAQGQPYPQGNFDLNLSPLEDGFVVEAGSSKGSQLMEKNASLFEEATEVSLAGRDEQRHRVIKEVEGNTKDNDIPPQELFKGIIAKNYESAIWEDEAKNCVECGACNAICPTCHCFLLYDQKDEERMARLRTWDSCLLKDFARVAGGANPRPRLWMRLRNRFEKKFDFFPRVADIYACTGCGRCISACPAKIDIRKVLRRLVNEAQ